MIDPSLLLVRFSAIGDCVMAAWAATAFRRAHPNGFLVWASESRCAPVIDRRQLVSRVEEFPRDRWKRGRWSPAIWREQILKYASMRHQRFEWGLDLQGHSKTAICLRIANPRKRIAARATDAFARRLNPTLPMDERGHTVEVNHAALGQFGEFVLPERPIVTPIPHREPMLATIAVSAGHPDKIYPMRQWQEVGSALRQAGMRVVFLGGPSDPQVEVPGTECLVGKLRLDETFALVANSAVHLAADTGTGHMAAAVGTPVVSVFGPTDPVVFRPYTACGTVLRVSDTPGDVTPSAVVEAALALRG